MPTAAAGWREFEPTAGVSIFQVKVFCNIMKWIFVCVLEKLCNILDYSLNDLIEKIDEIKKIYIVMLCYSLFQIISIIVSVFLCCNLLFDTRVIAVCLHSVADNDQWSGNLKYI